MMIILNKIVINEDRYKYKDRDDLLMNILLFVIIKSVIKG